MQLKKRLIFAALIGLGAVSAHAQNIVNNGSFETGDFSSWTLVGDPNNNFVDTGFASDGTFAAYFGEVGGIGTLTQALSTTIGQQYTVSFDFAGDGDSPSSFSAAFGGQTLLSVTDPPFDFTYLPYTYNVTATSTTTNLVFGFRDDDIFINLDNVKVVAQPVPEPASMAVLGVGALAVIRRRRAKKSV